MFISQGLLACLALSSVAVAGVLIPQRDIGYPRAASACDKTLPEGQEAGGGFYNISTHSSGVPRWYLITIPEKYNSQAKTPVILSYHGGKKNATEQYYLSQLSNPQFNDFAIAVYPNGLDRTWQGNPKAHHSTNDTLFTTEILDTLEKTYCIDASRIYSSGKSNGGGFTNTLACDPILSKRIAAFAPVSGSYYVDVGPDPTSATCDPNTLVQPCHPGRPKIPMLIFHGERDSTINFTGGIRSDECLPTIPHFVHEWARRDDLGTKNATGSIGGDTDIYRYGEGDEEGLVTLYADSTLHHDWPSTEPNDDNKHKGHGGPASFDATPIIVEFFLKHPLVD